MLKLGSGPTFVRILGGPGVATALSETCRAADWGTGLLAQAQNPAGGKIVGGGKSYGIEGLVVAALFAAALFAVCRSSRRN